MTVALVVAASHSRRVIAGCARCRRRLERPTGPNTLLMPYVRRVQHQQLFLALLTAPSCCLDGAPGAPPTEAATPDRWQATDDLGPAPAACCSSLLPLWRCGPAQGEGAENPWLAWGLHLAHTMAEARGISPHLRSLLNRTLIMLLAEHRGGELIRSSDFHGVLRDRKISTEHISEVLERMGVLLDDRPASFEKWLTVKLDGLAPGIRSETERWVRAPARRRAAQPSPRP